MTLREIKEGYAKAFAEGNFPTLEELIEEHPDHAEELAEFCLNFWPFANHLKGRMAETLLWWVDEHDS